MTKTPPNNKRESAKPGSANQLKHIFDESLAILAEGASSVGAVRSSVPMHIDPVSLQKRALSDAANALAALWKISGPGTPKLQNGAVQYSR